MPYPHPATEESYANYRWLMDSTRYLPPDKLCDRFVYLIHAWNSYIGIWVVGRKGFMILREKFGRLFLDVEYHWDTGNPFGTAKPFIQLDGPVSPGTEREALDAKHNEIPFTDYMARTSQFYQ